jgi:hypothetical protein|tara:strand:- start:98 stop:280 length:183 start_codon:yes stop_codon:yes gene_type:complete
MTKIVNWEEYSELEEELEIQETREKILHKKNKLNKTEKKGYENNVKRDKKNSWITRLTRV